MPNLTTSSQTIPPDPHDPEVLFCVASGRSVAGNDKHGRQGIVVVVVDVGGVLVNAISTAYQLQVDTTNEGRRGRKEGSEVEGPAALWCFSVELPEQTRYSDRQKTNSQLTEISRPCWRGIHIVYKVIGNRRIVKKILL